MLAVIVTLGVVFIDQLTKILVRTFMDVGESVTLIPHVMDLTRAENRGAAFGMLGDSRWVFIVISSITIVVLSFILYKYNKSHPLFTVSVSMVLGGGIGNMIDRLFFTNAAGEHVVTDFLEPTFMDFAIFNGADSFITVGAILLGIYIIFIEPKLQKKNKSGIPEEIEENEEETGEENE